MVSAGMPAEFAGLARDQRMVADFFFGGQRIGQFEVEASPGSLRILQPERVLAAVPGLVDPAAVRVVLSGMLETNARFLCASADAVCARPMPEIAAIVLDQQRFRVDLYINPRLLAIRSATADRYLRQSVRGPTLVDTVSGALVGGSTGPLIYSLRNRAVLGLGTVRLLSDTSISSGRSVDVDTFAAQMDRPDLRYTAGVYYVPGADLVGRRRIVGAGFASQFDTRADRTIMTGTPLIVFLGQRARVDLYSSGRLIASRVYDAGNQALDTSGLPDGAYPVEIRIQEASGAARSETRFFTKSASIPPPGRTIFFANAGLLAADREGPLLGVSHVPLAVAGAARRFGTHFAFDGVLMATNRKRLAEVGVSFLTRPMQARVAVLGSTVGDYGVVAQAVSASAGRLGYNFDLRHVHSRDGKSLIPIGDAQSATISATDIAAQQAQILGRTFTQLFANLSYRIGQAQIGASAYAQRDGEHVIRYAIGPTIRWPILQRERLQVSLDGSYAATNRGRSFAAGLRLQVFGRRSAINANLGAQSNAIDRRTSGYAQVGGSIQRDHVLGGEMSASGDIQTGGEGTLLRASADGRGPAGYGSASVIQRFDHGRSATQFALALQSAIVADAHAIRIGARDQNDSVIAVRLTGGARDTRFEVLIDDSPEGIVAPGKRLTIAVPPYRRYTVRIRPLGTDLVSFDAKPRTIDVYPGSVASLAWKADLVTAMFGRIVQPDGSIIANADITTDGAIAATDDRGYFQLQAAHDAVLTVRRSDGSVCKAMLAAAPSTKAYTALGDVTCRP
ncbi:TcfC E-set like domain-containing protein [Sphingomonas natans]|nr:TcfC E-set like domain-containing protein [Sphingomonas sp. BIUV-7]